MKCPHCGADIDLPKSPSSQALGRTGGKARLVKMTDDERRAVAKLGGQARWASRQKKTKVSFR